MQEREIGRFWSKVDLRAGRDGCWIWTGCRARQYGQARIGGEMLYAHRVSWAQAHGPIPSGLDVLHHCDNPPCVNPVHLWLGTHKQNMIDKNQKRRAKTKLTRDQVIAIHARANAGERNIDLAAEYGVGDSTVSEIRNKRAWAWVHA